MTSKPHRWLVPVLAFGAAALVAAPIVVSCSPSCEELDNCGPYQPPPGGGSGEAGSPDSGAGATGSSGGNSAGGGTAPGGSAGDLGASGGGAGAAGTPATAPCGGVCSGNKPLCDEDSNRCVQCVAPADCSGAKDRCNPVTNECVACLTSTDCTDASAPQCEAGACVPCATKQDCAHITGKPVCDAAAAECVQCTAGDEAACGTKSCNPATRTCTSTLLGSKRLCEACVADSECIGGNQADPETRCVPMAYAGAARPGGFCLRRVVKTCEPPFAVVTTQRSLSGASAEGYCGIGEQTTKCEAVRDLLNDRSCPGGTDAECGCVRNENNECIGTGETGLCRTVGVLDNRCTYRCGTNANCPESLSCSSTSPKYCN